MNKRNNPRTSSSVDSSSSPASGINSALGAESPQTLSSQFSVHSQLDTSLPSSMSSQSPYESTCEDGSCPVDSEATFPVYHDDSDPLEYSDALPSQKELDQAANINVYDADGVSRPFRNLYEGTEHQGQRQLIIFVRHFYCMACQVYLKALTDTITPSAYFSLPVPTTITIIGCGLPHLIPKYTTTTACPFRVYSDPTRQLYKALGMKWTVNVGRKRPEYLAKYNVMQVVTQSLMQILRRGRGGGGGGLLTQIGGEFLFGDGEPIWCHRMKDVRNHTEMGTLKKVLEMEDEVPVVEEAKVVPLTSTSLARPTGLRMVWEDNGVTARLQRESRLVTAE